jgi:hypothetical protein
MKTSDLKKIIKECIKEELQSNTNENFLDTIKNLGSAAKKTYQTAQTQGYSDQFKRFKNSINTDLQKAYYQAKTLGAKAKMKPETIDKEFVGNVMGFLNITAKRAVDDYLKGKKAPVKAPSPAPIPPP